MLGFLDVALGWLSGTAEWQDGVAAIITQDWTAWAVDRQPAWQEFSASGRLSAETIWRFASEPGLMTQPTRSRPMAPLPPE